MLSIKNLTFAWDQHVLFDDVSIDLPQSEVVQLIGENGTGKTTLLQLMAGMIPHFNRSNILQGSVELNNRSMFTYPPKYFYPTIAFIPSTHIDLFLLTDNLNEEIMLTRSILKLSAEQTEKKITEFAQFFPGIRDIFSRQFKRVSFPDKVLALTFVFYLQGATLYLFDEVINRETGLVNHWYDFFNALSTQKCSVLFVSHHLKSNQFVHWILKNKKIIRQTGVKQN